MTSTTPTAAQIDEPGPADVARLLALNNRHAEQTSPLDEDRLRHLLAQRFHLGMQGGPPPGDLDAFLLALDQGADYDSPNFRWLRDRHPRFVYVDRVITAAAARGRGLARGLYEQLFRRAEAAGHDRVLCEVNLLPPNPGSDAFHHRLGFREIGRAAIGAGKVVRYLQRDLDPGPEASVRR